MPKAASPPQRLSSRPAIRRALRAAGYRGAKSQRNRATREEAWAALLAARAEVQRAIDAHRAD